MTTDPVPVDAPTTPTASLPAPEPTPGLLLPCPQCGEAEATIVMNLAEMTEFHCQECEADFSRAELDNFLEKWMRMLAWIDTAPRS